MQADFWRKKWQGPKQGFNQAQPNALMVEHFEQLNLPKNSCIFVPLCGKSIDMVWLTEQGYEVIGCELVDSVVQSFFDEHNINVEVVQHPHNDCLRCYQGRLNGKDIRIWSGDIFQLTSDDVVNNSAIDAVYDRAALVAMPQNENNNMRALYTQHVIELTQAAPQFLITLGLVDDDESVYSKIPGPPFFITTTELTAYYGNNYGITLIAQNDDIKRTSKGRLWTNLVWYLLPKKQLS